MCSVLIGAADTSGGNAGGKSRVLEEMAGVGSRLTRAQMHNFDVVSKAAAFRANLREIIEGLTGDSSNSTGGGGGSSSSSSNGNSNSSANTGSPTTHDGRPRNNLVATATSELGPAFAALESVGHHVCLCPLNRSETNG